MASDHAPHARAKSVHGARHLNVGKQQGDVGARFKDRKGFVRINGLDSAEARVFDNIDGAHAKQHLILDDENIRRSIQMIVCHGNSLGSSPGTPVSRLVAGSLAFDLHPAIIAFR